MWVLKAYHQHIAFWELSGGMKKEKETLIFQDPIFYMMSRLTGLDPITRQEIIELMVEINKNIIPPLWLFPMIWLVWEWQEVTVWQYWSMEHVMLVITMNISRNIRTLMWNNFFWKLIMPSKTINNIKLGIFCDFRTGPDDLLCCILLERMGPFNPSHSAQDAF